MDKHWEKLVESAKNPELVNSQCIADIGKKLGFITEGKAPLTEEPKPQTTEVVTETTSRKKRSK